MTTQPTQPAVVSLSDEDVDRIAVATTAKIKAELLSVADVKGGRTIGRTLALTYDGVTAIRKRLGA